MKVFSPHSIMWKYEKVFIPDIVWEYKPLVSHYYIENKEKYIFILICLYTKQLITKEALMGRIGSLNSGSWNSKKSNFNDKILNHWFNDITFSELIYEYEKQYPNLSISVLDFLKGLNLVLNKNRSYCVNYIIFEYLHPYLKYCYWSKYIEYKQFNDLNIVDNSGSKYWVHDRWEPSYYCDIKFMNDFQELNRMIVNKLLEYKERNFKYYEENELDFTFH